MPKKTKRKVSAVVTPAPAPEVMEVRTVNAPAAPTASSRSFSRRTSSTAQVEFSPDYGYVVKDLKRIFSMAAVFFVILIALSFILPMLQH